MEYDTDVKSTSEINKDTTSELPDGNIIIDDVQRFRFVIVFFQSSYTGKEASGFRDYSFQNVVKCDVNIRKNLWPKWCETART